jgi:hypothetical protein
MAGIPGRPRRFDRPLLMGKLQPGLDAAVTLEENIEPVMRPCAARGGAD